MTPDARPSGPQGRLGTGVTLVPGATADHRAPDLSPAPADRRACVRAAAIVLAVLAFGHPAGAATAEEMYSHALTQERALRAPGQNGNVPLSELRTMVALYEEIVRLYPNSGFSDHALWQASGLALEAFDQFRQARDLETGLRLLRLLERNYPASLLAGRTAERLRQFEALKHPARITAIRREPLDDVVRVTIELDGEPRFHFEELANPHRVFFDLRSATADPPLRDATLSFDDDVVREIRLGRHPNQTTRVVLDLADVPRYRVLTLYDPFRLVIDCERAAVAAPLIAERIALPPLVPPSVAARDDISSYGTSRIPVAFVPPVEPATPAEDRLVSLAPVEPVEPDPGEAGAGATVTVDAPTSPAANSDGSFSLARQLGLGISRLVIDPGHGGHDPGARAGGLVEADLVLDVARRLEQRLVASGLFEVVLTRRTNEYVPLEERTALANRVDADLFLSIHANASRNRQARGVETYFLNFASDVEAEAQAARENSASEGAMRNLPSMVRAITTNTKVDESRDFAQLVQAALVSSLQELNPNAENLGVKQAPFVVLIGASMPSILTEVSFLSHREEARLLTSDDYRDRIADALLEGILRYQRSLKQVQTVALQ